MTYRLLPDFFRRSRQALLLLMSYTVVYINNNHFPKEMQKYVLTTMSSWKPEVIISMAPL